MNRRLNAQGANVPTETKRAEPEAGTAKHLPQVPVLPAFAGRSLALARCGKAATDVP